MLLGYAIEHKYIPFKNKKTRGVLKCVPRVFFDEAINLLIIAYFQFLLIFLFCVRVCRLLLR